jgi:Icc-related predicted phosphoesterase
MTRCYFVSDLHGHTDRFRKLFLRIYEDRPDAVFLGGDLLPHGIAFATQTADDEDFIDDILVSGFMRIREQLGDSAPEVFLILGNDDGRSPEAEIIDAAEQGAWQYIHNRKVRFGEYTIYGYNYVPPTPFAIKDWERYDVSRYVDPGCIPPTEGKRSYPVDRHEIEYATIAKDLNALTDDDDMTHAVCLFHSPPYKTNLDRVALDGKMIDHVPLDVHIGSIAMERFIKSRQPYLTLHGHVHESAHLTGSWQDKIGRTLCFSAAHHGAELALIRFDLENPETAVRELL